MADDTKKLELPPDPRRSFAARYVKELEQRSMQNKWTVKSDGIPGGEMETPHRKEAMTTAISASLRGENHAASVFQWNPSKNKNELAAVYTEGRGNVLSDGFRKMPVKMPGGGLGL